MCCSKLFSHTIKRDIERAIKTDSYRLAVRLATQLSLEQLKQKVAEAFPVKLANIDRIFAQEAFGASQGLVQSVLSNLTPSFFNVYNTPPPPKKVSS